MKTVELIKELKAEHPYPTDLFHEPTKEEWAKFHAACNIAGFDSSPFVGAAARIGYDACISRMKDLTEL